MGGTSDDDLQDLLDRSAAASTRSAGIVARSGAALSRLVRLTGREGDAPPPATAPPAGAPSAQMRRRHVVVVNSDPAFLDAARVLLQGERYNVTTTNLVPATHALIRAAGADALVVDLKLGQPQIWDLLARLRDIAGAASLPVVLTSTDPGLLDAAEAGRWPPGGTFLLLRPFVPGDLVDVVHALIGPA
jgi:CheY-like chemotaxis protein